MQAECQVVEVSPPKSEGEGTPATEDLQLNLYESESEGEDGLMVSGPVHSLTAQVDIVVIHSG